MFKLNTTTERRGQGITALTFAVFLAALVAGGETQASTVDDIKQRDALRCGVSQGVPGFSNPTSAGQWEGFDVDICHALAAAVLGDASKILIKPLSAGSRFDALARKEVDVLTRNTSLTYGRDAGLGFTFAGISFYDSQGFMVNEKTGLTSVGNLNGASICVTSDTTSQENLDDFFRSKGMQYTPVLVEHPDFALAAYDSGRCDAFSGDLSALAAHRLKLNVPDEHRILPETIAKEPLGPVVRQGDDEWSDIVRWTLMALLAAEEHGVTQANVEEKLKNSPNPEVNRMLGAQGDFGSMLGVDKHWVVTVIKAVGNYNEIFDRHLGFNTPLSLSRGINELWINGGLMYPLPFR